MVGAPQEVLVKRVVFPPRHAAASHPHAPSLDISFQASAPLLSVL